MTLGIPLNQQLNRCSYSATPVEDKSELYSQSVALSGQFICEVAKRLCLHELTIISYAVTHLQAKQNNRF